MDFRRLLPEIRCQPGLSPVPGTKRPATPMTPLAQKIREGDTRALSRVATGIENRDPQALETLRELETETGHARIGGIPGPPGAGKSTLVDALALELRKQGKTLAILAVDPSSRTRSEERRVGKERNFR